MYHWAVPPWHSNHKLCNAHHCTDMLQHPHNSPVHIAHILYGWLRLLQQRLLVWLWLNCSHVLPARSVNS